MRRDELIANVQDVLKRAEKALGDLSDAESDAQTGVDRINESIDEVQKISDHLTDWLQELQDEDEDDAPTEKAGTP